MPDGHRGGVPRRLVPLRRPRACWHPDGYVELRDRAKDMIISGGENISTSRSSRRSSAHPAVLECAVVAIPRRALGRAAQGVRRRSTEGAEATRGGADRVLPRAPGPLQVPRRRRVRRAAEDVDRQGAEVRAARARVGRAREGDRVSGARRSGAGRLDSDGAGTLASRGGRLFDAVGASDPSSASESVQNDAFMDTSPSPGSCSGAPAVEAARGLDAHLGPAHAPRPRTGVANQVAGLERELRELRARSGSR